MRKILLSTICVASLVGCMQQGMVKVSGDAYSGNKIEEIEVQMDKSVLGGVGATSWLLVSPNRITNKSGVSLGFNIDQTYKNDEYTSPEMNVTLGRDVGRISHMICLADGKQVKMPASVKGKDYGSVDSNGFGNYGYSASNKAFVDATLQDFKTMAAASQLNCKLYGSKGSVEYVAQGATIGSGKNKINPKFHQAVRDFYSKVLTN